VAPLRRKCCESAAHRRVRGGRADTDHPDADGWSASGRPVYRASVRHARVECRYMSVLPGFDDDDLAEGL